MKKYIAAIAASALGSGSAFGAAGIYDSFVIVESTFYDAGATSGNPDFDTANLGSFDVNTDTISLGGQQKSFKNNGSDVTAHTLSWVIYEQGNRPASPSFSDISYSFQWNNGDSGAPSGLNNPGDQQWGTDVQGANGTDGSESISLSSLTPGSTYSLELFTKIDTNGVDAASEIFNNNGGSNYVAEFSAVPEPSSFAMIGGLLALGLVGARRRVGK